MLSKTDKEFDLIHGMKVTRENMGWLFDLMENQQSELQISKEKEYKFSLPTLPSPHEPVYLSNINQKLEDKNR